MHQFSRFHLTVVCGVAIMVAQGNFALAFSSNNLGSPRASSTSLEMKSSAASNASNELRNLAVASAICFSSFMTPMVSNAGEIGVEVEAPTFTTGETVEICTKRGPLGACLKTEMRTESNDNDIAKKYFRDPAELIKQREAAMRAESDEGNALIAKLKQQSLDNAEKNDLLVQRKTFENDQAANFGPFDRQVLIMNTDGKTFTLLENPQAMRLKKAGFIDNRKQFIKQPTQEELDNALESEGGFLSGIFGGN